MTTRRAGRFGRLVDDFDTVCRDAGVTLARQKIERLLTERITAVAQRMRVTERTALRSYFSDTWGTETATRLCADLSARQAALDATPDSRMPVWLVARLIAALGQAQLFAAINTDLDDVHPDMTGTAGPHRPHHEPLNPPMDTADYDGQTAANATTGLALAVHVAFTTPAPPEPEAVPTIPARRSHAQRPHDGPAHRPVGDAASDAGGDSGDAGDVAVPGPIAGQTRQTLHAFAELLGSGAWRSCHCGPDDSCTERDTPHQVREAVRRDLELLDATLDAAPTAGEDDGPGPQHQGSPAHRPRPLRIV